MFFNYIQPLNKRAVLLLHHQKQSYTNGPVTSALRKYIQSNEIQEDAQQLNLATKLDDLHKYLSATDSSALSHEQLTVETELNHRSYFSPLSKFAAYSRKAIQTNFRSNFRPNPKGIYVYGSVGVGKTFTMDLFFDECRKSNATTRRRQRRAHFHEFMLDVHERIHLYKKDFPKSDPIPPVALQIAQESQLLCFDEFQVTDIADAMIMKRLFSLLFDIGVVVVSTSNRPPNALYEGGLNRSQFLPFIDVLKDKCEIVSMDEVHDYRKDTLMPDVPYSYFYPSGSNETNASLETIFSGTELNELNESKESKLNNPKKKETEKDQRNNLLNLELWELQDELDSRGCDIDHKKWGGLSTKRKKKKLIFYLMKEMEKKNETTIDVFPQKEQFFEKRTEYQNKQKEQKEKKELKELSKKEWKEIVPVMMGRKLEVLRANKTCGWFNFKELCHQPLGAADYIAISQRFPVVIIDSVPQLGASYYNEARRFVTMIDAMYEANCRLVIASTVPLDSLFVSFEATVETKDGDEEIAVMEQTSNIDVGNDEQGQEQTSTAIKKNTGIPTIKENAIANQQGDEESWVSGEGGSSSSGATTMIRTKDGDMEWSATGRIGVSLAQLSAVKDVVFSFKRAESRLMEMSGTDWGREN